MQTTFGAVRVGDTISMPTRPGDAFYGIVRPTVRVLSVAIERDDALGVTFVDLTCDGGLTYSNTSTEAVVVH